MTISAAIKRLQILEDKHGPTMQLCALVVTDRPEGSSDVVAMEPDEPMVFDVLKVDGYERCFLMPQDFFETVAPKGVPLDER